MERDSLMKKLVEVEMDGQAAIKQTTALRDTIRRLKEALESNYLLSCFTDDSIFHRKRGLPVRISPWLLSKKNCSWNAWLTLSLRTVP
jgi:hypothetical protein